MSRTVPEPILVSDPGEEPVYALVCLIKGEALQELRHRLGALPGPRSELLVVLAELFEDGEVGLAYLETYRSAVLGLIAEVERREGSAGDDGR